jgi:ATP-dependent DNA helicase RecG
VIREAVVNALMHRDYSPQARGTQVQVRPFPDRLTLTGPGGLFGNVRLETLGQSGTSSSRNARLAALLQEAGDPFTGRPVAENRGSGISMMISQVRRDTGLVPLFAASLDEFQVTIPRTSLLFPEQSALMRRLSRGQDLSEAQISVLSLANAGYDVDIALLRRMGLGFSDARRQFGQLNDLGLLQPRRARDDGSYWITSGLSEIVAREEAMSSHGSGLPERILKALGGTDPVSREELQEATGASRSSVINALGELITSGAVEAAAPSRSPNRRYRRTRS